LKKLIRKYFTTSLSESELEVLRELLQDSDNQRLFEKYVQDYYDLNLAYQEPDLELEYHKIPKIGNWGEGYSNKRPWANWYKIAAAVIVVAFGLGHYFSPTVERPDTNLSKGVITITLSDGETKVIQEDREEAIHSNAGKVVGFQKGTVINYSNGAFHEEEHLVYNELAIPNGKTFQIILSDGTKVHLNAGSKLKYPVQFLKKGNRQVFLDGEAYFEVAKDESNPFIVSTSEINVQALGTMFNVNSYDDAVVNTVLVEGSVGLYGKDEVFDENTSAILEPNQIAVWDKTKKLLTVDQVDDVNEYIAWTKGKLLFKIRPFTEIIKVLERHYDVVIINDYRKLDNLRFFATFDVETIDEVMAAFQNSEPFSYTRNGKYIIIKKPKNN